MTTKNANRVWLTSGELAVCMALKWFHPSQPISNTFTESKKKQHLYGNLLHSAQHEFHFFTHAIFWHLLNITAYFLIFCLWILCFWLDTVSFYVICWNIPAKIWRSTKIFHCFFQPTQGPQKLLQHFSSQQLQYYKDELEESKKAGDVYTLWQTALHTLSSPVSKDWDQTR